MCARQDGSVSGVFPWVLVGVAEALLPAEQNELGIGETSVGDSVM